jgi:hypothetical protein
MTKVEKIMEDLCRALKDEYNTKEPPVLFLDKESYYGLVTDMRNRLLNPQNSSGSGQHFSITMMTPYGFDLKIFNKTELYALTNVINKICEDE